MSPINILHVINEWPAGGIQEQVYLLIKHLPKDRFNHFVIGFRQPDGFFFKKYQECGAINIIDENVNYPKMEEVVKQYNIDIVHKQTGGGDCPDYIFRIKDMGVKLVESLHCPRQSSIPIDLVDRIVFTTPYTISKATKEQIYSQKFHSIQYSIDLDSPLVESPKKRAKQDKIVVGRLGRIVQDKRPDVIVKLAEISNNLFGDKIQFKLAGYCPDDNMKAQLLSVVSKLPNLSYEGFVENKYEFWNSLDICINPVWETSFDIVFLEAMACGLPILTWDNSAAKYVVYNAGMIPPEDMYMLFSGLVKLYKDPELCRVLGENGIKQIKEKYSLSNFVKKWSQFYEDIVIK